MRVPFSNHSVCLSVRLSVHLSVHPQFFVDAAMAKVFKLPYPNWVWRQPMRDRCAWAWNFGPVTYNLGAITLTLGILWMLVCLKLLMPVWPMCAYGLPMRRRCAWAWDFGSVTFDFGVVTLTLGIWWALLCPRYWCQCGQSLSVDYPWGIGAHGLDILLLWPLTLI